MGATIKRAPAQTLGPPPTVADKFRNEIAIAAADGAGIEALTLHLTLGDVEQLKRDRKVALEDIHFHGGNMTYLGVKVVKGAAGPSALKREAAEVVAEG